MRWRRWRSNRYTLHISGMFTTQLGLSLGAEHLACLFDDASWLGGRWWPLWDTSGQSPSKDCHYIMELQSVSQLHSWSMEQKQRYFTLLRSSKTCPSMWEMSCEKTMVDSNTQSIWTCCAAANHRLAIVQSAKSAHVSKPHFSLYCQSLCSSLVRPATSVEIMGMMQCTPLNGLSSAKLVWHGRLCTGPVERVW